MIYNNKICNNSANKINIIFRHNNSLSVGKAKSQREREGSAICFFGSCIVRLKTKADFHIVGTQFRQAI